MTVEELRKKYKEKTGELPFCHEGYGTWLEQQLIELKKPFAVSVTIPEPYDDGHCNYMCPLKTTNSGGDTCNQELCEHIPCDGDYECKPGPGCPRWNNNEERI
jgi:hypothetical protein